MNEPTEGHSVTVPVGALRCTADTFISRQGKKIKTLSQAHTLSFPFPPFFFAQIPVETKIRGEVERLEKKKRDKDKKGEL